MDITIKINCDNDAFKPQPAYEVSRILNRLREKLRSEGRVREHRILDSNGNSVGEVQVDGEPEEGNS